MNVNFTTGVTALKNFEVHPATADKDKRRVTGVTLNGDSLSATPRFWNSILSRFGQSDSVFKYFTHKEVFDRIAEREGNTNLKFTLEHRNAGNPRLLAVVREDAIVPSGNDVEKLFGRFNPQAMHYTEGLMTGHFVPRSGESVQAIGEDMFRNRFAMQVPVDGYGKPQTFLELLRVICGNGAIGLAPAFRQIVNVGDNPIYTLERALGSFDDGDGFQRLRSRFDMAQKSWATVREVEGLRQMMARANGVGATPEMMLKLTRMTGDIAQIYGIVSLNAVSTKKQAVLPTKATMYDLINYATELATHHTDNRESRVLQGWVGQTLSEEFDMENTVTETREFADFFITE